TTIALVLALKILLFVFAAQAFVVLANRDLGWLDMWNRWDARIYVDLARQGYVSSGPHESWIVFFPLYPWLVCLFEIVVGDYRFAAILVSAIASVAAALLLRRLTSLDQAAPVARNAVWFLFIFPTSYFLHIGYTEALFLAFILGSFLAARREHWPLAGALGAAACLTRVTGLALFPALAAEAWLQYRTTRRFDPRWLWIGLLAAGIGIYLALNFYVTGDPFAFTKFENKNWAKHLAPPWVGLNDLWRGLSERPPADSLMISSYELFFIGLALAGTVWSWFRLRASYTIWMLANLLLIICNSFISSAPRYDLALFPLFIWAARVSAERPLVHALLSAVSLLFLGLFATAFVLNHWAF
ncbi:MAG: hypothetical protein ACRD5Z_00585, partial [Bryobacteraceae bacterium]